MTKAEIIKRPIEQIGSEVKKSAWTAVFESLAIIILGILFVAWPDVMMKAVTYVVGALFIIKGGFQVINYFIEGGQKDYFNNNLLSGVVSILIGITALVIGDGIANIFRIIVGVWLIYESLVRISTSIKLYSAGINAWKYVSLLALVVLVLGIFVTFNDIASVIGWMMIAAGVVSVIGDVVFIQQVDNFVDKLTGKAK